MNQSAGVSVFRASTLSIGMPQIGHIGTPPAALNLVLVGGLSPTMSLPSKELLEFRVSIGVSCGEFVLDSSGVISLIIMANRNISRGERAMMNRNNVLNANQCDFLSFECWLLPPLLHPDEGKHVPGFLFYHP